MVTKAIFALLVAMGCHLAHAQDVMKTSQCTSLQTRFEARCEDDFTAHESCKSLYYRLCKQKCPAFQDRCKADSGEQYACIKLRQNEERRCTEGGTSFDEGKCASIRQRLTRLACVSSGCSEQQFYSVSKDRCVQECSPDDLQDEFTLYKDTFPEDANNYDRYWLSFEEGTKSLADCKKRCLAKRKCVSLSFELDETPAKDHLCGLFKEMPNTKYVEYTNNKYLKRTCA